MTHRDQGASVWERGCDAEIALKTHSKKISDEQNWQSLIKA
jgi:hypothetical protein